MKPVLLTGGAGYVGSHTAKALGERGWEPVVLDNLSTGNRWAVKWGPFVYADLSDPDAIRGAIRTYQPEAIIHLAASAYVGESVDDPRKYFRNNVINSLNLLEIMVDEGINMIVFSSSCATYGLPASLPITETCPQNPVNPYGETKLVIEKALTSFGRAYGIRAAILRYFNAAGADPDGDIGEAHNPETHLIPLVIEAGLGVRAAVDIYGTDYATTDGTAVRDYVHVSDLAQAHVLALDRLRDGNGSFACNLGNSRGVSVREVVAAVERVSGRTVPCRPAPRRVGDPPVLISSARKALDWLGWAPRFSELETIVGTAWAWHLKRHRDGAECHGQEGARVQPSSSST